MSLIPLGRDAALPGTTPRLALVDDDNGDTWSATAALQPDSDAIAHTATKIRPEARILAEWPRKSAVARRRSGRFLSCVAHALACRLFITYACISASDTGWCPATVFWTPALLYTSEKRFYSVLIFFLFSVRSSSSAAYLFSYRLPLLYLLCFVPTCLDHSYLFVLGAVQRFFDLRNPPCG